MRKNQLSLIKFSIGLTLGLTSLAGISQNVNIPDANFKSFLVGQPSINTNSDSEIQVTEAQAYSGMLNCGSQGISDFTGIEDFTNITGFVCYSNPVVTLDLTQNTALESINCNSAQLTSLDVSGNTSLTALYCSNNDLTSLDITNNIALEDLYCVNNQLTALDVSNNINLLDLKFSGNQITNVDLSSNVDLTILHCFNNQITSLDLSMNTALTNLSFYDNAVVTVDLSNNPMITDLHCNGNNMTSLDLSSNTALTSLFCYDNQLNYLNVANGNNTNIVNFFAEGNSSLSCIMVDDAAYSTSNWTDIDAGASFSESCPNIAGVDEHTNEISVYPNPVSEGMLSINSSNNIEKITVFNLLGEEVISRMAMSNELKLNLSEVPKGLYLLNIKTGDKIETIKIEKN